MFYHNNIRFHHQLPLSYRYIYSVSKYISHNSHRFIIVSSMIFFSYFYSIVVANTSKLLFFHYFLIVLCVLYATIVPYPSLFTSYYLSFPHFFHRFSSHFKYSFQIFHCFPILFPLFYGYISSFFHCFVIIFPFIVIFPIPAQRADQMGINTPPSPIATWYITHGGFFSGGGSYLPLYLKYKTVGTNTLGGLKIEGTNLWGTII